MGGRSLSPKQKKTIANNKKKNAEKVKQDKENKKQKTT